MKISAELKFNEDCYLDKSKQLVCGSENDPRREEENKIPSRVYLCA